MMSNFRQTAMALLAAVAVVEVGDGLPVHEKSPSSHKLAGLTGQLPAMLPPCSDS